jgi:hypothetical protein
MYVFVSLVCIVLAGVLIYLSTKHQDSVLGNKNVGPLLAGFFGYEAVKTFITKDASFAALAGLAAGLAVMGGICFFLYRRSNQSEPQ